MDCKSSDIVSCVSSNPAIAMAALKGFSGFVVGLVILYFMYGGFLNRSNSTSIWQLFAKAWKGFSSIIRLGVASSPDKDKWEDKFKGSALPQKFLFFASIVAVIAISWYLPNASVFAVIVLVLVFGLFNLVRITVPGSFSSQTLSSLSGGLLWGVVVAMIIYAFRFFTISDYNGFGDTISILFLIFCAFGLFAWYGSSGSKPAAAKPTKKKKPIVVYVDDK